MHISPAIFFCHIWLRNYLATFSDFGHEWYLNSTVILYDLVLLDLMVILGDLEIVWWQIFSKNQRNMTSASKYPRGIEFRPKTIGSNWSREVPKRFWRSLKWFYHWKSRKPYQLRSRLSSENFVSTTKYCGGGIGEILNLWQNSLDMKDLSRSGDPLVANSVHLKLDLVADFLEIIDKFCPKKKYLSLLFISWKGKWPTNPSKILRQNRILLWLQFIKS